MSFRTGFSNEIPHFCALKCAQYLFYSFGRVPMKPWAESSANWAPAVGLRNLIGFVLKHFGSSSDNLVSKYARGFWCNRSWDQIEAIRSRLRAKEPLLKLPDKKGADATISECIANNEILIPVLHRLQVSQLKLPDISSLREEVGIVYSKSSRD